MKIENRPRLNGHCEWQPVSHCRGQNIESKIQVSHKISYVLKLSKFHINYLVVL